jgi:hypothetical protein
VADVQTGKHDDYRRMSLEDFDGVEDVYMFDASLEVYLYGENITETIDLVDVSVPQVSRTY